jgi:segregation and condensation protein B
MNRIAQPAEQPGDSSSHDDKPHVSSPFSLSRLRDAFAEMLGAGTTDGSVIPTEGSSQSQQTKASNHNAAGAGQPSNACEICPRSVVEAMLFVGKPDNATFSSRELAASIRGVSPAEIENAVAELNAMYDDDTTPYRIDASNAGYRLALRDDFDRMRDKFYGRVREAKLSPGAVEVLSIVAYNQPATAEEINQLRGTPSSAALSTLVRRKLVRLERSAGGGAPSYWTTDRFLRLFGLNNLAALPRSEELEKV